VLNLENIHIDPKPDFNRLLKAFKRGVKADRVPFFELFSNLVEAIAGPYVDRSKCKDETDYVIKRHIFYQTKLGYDFVNATCGTYFKIPDLDGGKEGGRDFVQGGDGLIRNEGEFERYAWPDFKNGDWSSFERVKKALPEGMKVIVAPDGVYMYVSYIMGYENLCVSLIENPELVKRVFDSVGRCLLELVTLYAAHDCVGAICIGEDLGFKTQTLLAPADLQKYCFPWHKKLVNAVHSKGKPVFIHSCGNLEGIYEDIIGAGYDAKHSYEDNILPVWEFKKRFGSRISSFGGFDMNKISLMTPEEVRKHTRFLIDNCAGNGGYAFGTGNSVANYVPQENFLTALEEAYVYGRH